MGDFRIELGDVQVFNFRLRVIAGFKVFVGLGLVAGNAGLLGAACEQEAAQGRHEEGQFIRGQFHVCWHTEMSDTFLV